MAKPASKSKPLSKVSAASVTAAGIKDNFFSPPALMLIGVTLLLYGNTLFNGYCLDDGLVFTNNDLVKKGFSGIGGILSHDSFYGGLGNAYNMSGGRWRPLSLVTFAIEYQLFGLVPWISHLINVLLYALTGIVLMKFLEKNVLITRKKSETINPSPNFQFSIFNFQSFSLSFIVALLFLIHPIHTEVVANIKGRDEILSLLFLILTLHYSLRAVKESGKTSDILKGVLCYSLAMLSKENGLTFILILPVTLFFFSNAKPSRIINLSLPVIGIAVLYILIRVSMIGFSTAPVTELLDNPYMTANFSEKFATIFFVFLFYIKLLIFPHPLTYDYSYNQVPFRSFSDPLVIFSLLIHIGLAWYVLRNWKKKDVLVWCILFYLSGVFIVSNMFINIGAFLAERFLYQSSIAFCLAFVVVINKLLEKITDNSKTKMQFAIAISILLFIPAAAKTITRNFDWKNDTVLFLHDEKVSSNSARAAMYAAIRYTSDSDTMKHETMKKEYLKKSLDLYYKSYSIYPNSASNYLNWGVVYSRMDSLERAEWAWNEARKIKPNSTLLKQNDKYLSQVYYKRGLIKGLKKDNNFDLKEAIVLLNKACYYDSTNAEYWYNLGGAYYTNSQLDSAKFCWEKTLSLDPNNTNAAQGLNALAKQFNLK